MEPPMTPSVYRRARLSVSGALCLCVLLPMAACAAARDPVTGEIVVGFGLTRLPETGNQLIASGLAAATGIPGIGSIALGGLGILGAAFGAKKAAEKKAEDRAWNEAQATYSPPPGMVMVPATLPPTTPVAPGAQPTGATV